MMFTSSQLRAAICLDALAHALRLSATNPCEGNLDLLELTEYSADVSAEGFPFHSYRFKGVLASERQEESYPIEGSVRLVPGPGLSWILGSVLGEVTLAGSEYNFQVAHSDHAAKVVLSQKDC